MFGVTSVAFALLWVRSREALLRAKYELAQRTHLEQRVDSTQRLDSIERTLDAIAVEVERLGESDRFTARLLAERLAAIDAPPPRSTPPAPARMTTPH